MAWLYLKSNLANFSLLTASMVIECFHIKTLRVHLCICSYLTLHMYITRLGSEAVVESNTLPVRLVGVVHRPPVLGSAVR